MFFFSNNDLGFQQKVPSLKLFFLIFLGIDLCFFILTGFNTTTNHQSAIEQTTSHYSITSILKESLSSDSKLFDGDMKSSANCQRDEEHKKWVSILLDDSRRLAGQNDPLSDNVPMQARCSHRMRSQSLPLYFKLFSNHTRSLPELQHLGRTSSCTSLLTCQGTTVPFSGSCIFQLCFVSLALPPC